ncbi:gag-pol polyprotein [Tanacetum coccineum]
MVGGIANPNMNPKGNGYVVAARAEGNGNGNNANQIRCYNCRGLGYLARNCTEEAGIQLQAEEFDLMAAVGDINENEEVNANCILMENLYVEHSGGTVEQHPATVEETCAYFESLYNNLAIEVKKVNTVNRKMKKTNADLTTKLARYKGQEKSFEINKA